MLVRWLLHWLFGPASMSDERMDGITLAILEEAERMGVKP